MSTEGDAAFYADDETERYSEEIFLKNRELEADFTKGSKSCQPSCEEQNSHSFARKIVTNDSLITIFITGPRNSRTTSRNSTSSTQKLITEN